MLLGTNRSRLSYTFKIWIIIQKILHNICTLKFQCPCHKYQVTLIVFPTFHAIAFTVSVEILSKRVKYDNRTYIISNFDARDIVETFLNLQVFT